MELGEYLQILPKLMKVPNLSLKWKASGGCWESHSANGDQLKNIHVSPSGLELSS